MRSPHGTIDYLAFTVFDYSSIDDVFLELGFEFEPLGYGGLRYRESARAVGCPARVYWDGIQAGMGIHVRLSGQALRAIERLSDFTSWEDFLRFWKKRGAKFTRLDVAIDDLSENRKTPSDIKELCLKGHVASVASLKKLKMSSTIIDGIPYETLYIGSRQSERMLRCYTKSLVCGDAFDGTRFEMEYKGSYAEAAVNTLLEHGHKALLGMMRAFIDFKDEHHNVKNVTERRSAAWWESLLQTAKFVVKVSKLVERTIERSMAWFKRQFAQKLYVFASVSGGSVQWFYDALEEGRERLNRVNSDLIRHSQNLDFSFA